MRRLFYSTLDQVINEIDVRFSHQNTKLYAALSLSALQPENSNFLDVKIVQPLSDLVNRTNVEAEFAVAKMHVEKFNGNEKTKPTTTKLVSEHCEALKAIPTVHLTLKLGVTFGASTESVRTLFLFSKLSCEIAGNR